jgi:ribose transport system permease protein
MSAASRLKPSKERVRAMSSNSTLTEVGPPRGPNLGSGAALKRRDWGSAVGRYSGLFFLAVIIVVFSIWVPSTFLSATTFKGILGDQAITLVLALGLLFSLAAGQYDLSCAQNLGLSAVLCASLIVDRHVPWVLASLITLVVGALIGALNGALVVLGVDSFIATLGMSSVLLALSAQLSGGVFIGPMPDSFQRMTTTSFWNVPLVAGYAVAVAFLIWYALEHTPAGRRTYAAGANPDAARLAGVRTAAYIFSSLVISGLVSAFAGVLVASKVGSISGAVGPPYLLPAIAACLLGTTQIKVGRFNVWGTVLAIVLLATGIKGVQLVGGQVWLTDLFNGLALIGAVSIAVMARKRRSLGIRAKRVSRRSGVSSEPGPVK